MSADKTVGFLITSAAGSPSKAEAETKKGYITRRFTEAQKTRNIFMFLHESTAYSLATGSTDIPFVAGATASDTNFETSDILQENTTYKIRMYDGEEILEKSFTTKSFSAGDTGSTGLIAYMGGLVAFARADVSLTIERKTEEIMLIPYADDTYRGNDIFYLKNDSSVRGSCTSNCGTGVSGAYVYGLRREANKLASIILIFPPQKNIVPDNWFAREGTNANSFYNVEIISE
ncbi:hypothetical protein P0082_11505 [Candidatus Haliotispira prima]|uniref:IgGFc-binding protein N-terminal domain-containing protein n=1 Tax=Candidatus Haliotispira prima TaxID=3034016 RepID=A0ABY8MGG8_9SPIO|nr:hypothetical protein P0082_11505 [Candidatus Haliotispira prima]